MTSAQLLSELGWADCVLEDIGHIITGKTPSTKDKENFDGDVPFVKPGDLDSGGYIATTVDTLSDIGFNQVPQLPKDSIMVTCIGNLGKIGITTKPSATNQQINSVILYQGISVKYVYHYLKTLRWWLEQEASATTVSIINKGKFSKAPITLPSVAEQKQIAAKLDELLAQVDTLKTRLDAITKILKRFRQSVLAAATNGNLTKDWREVNKIECAWANVKLSDIANIQGGITKDSKKQSLNDEEVPYLRVANVQRGFIDLTEIKTIRIPENKLGANLLEPGDILFNEGGDLDKLGRGWVWEGQIDRCSFQNHVFRARLYDKCNQPKYVSWWGNYRGLEYFIRSGKQTTNLASINKTMLSNLPLLLPLPEEQAEIVSRVEQLFIYADQIEERIKDAQSRVNHLTHAILAKAFRGELTAEWRDQNPDLISGENSIEALLARIKKERQLFDHNKVTKRRIPKKPGESMQAKAIIPIIDALKSVGKPLSSQELLAQAGYPNDASTDQLEVFFLDIREQLDTNAITRVKRRIPKKPGESMQAKAIIPIIDALKSVGKPLSSQELLAQAGYPNDASTDQLEVFFLDIREQLDTNAITRVRTGETDFFALAE